MLTLKWTETDLRSEFSNCAELCDVIACLEDKLQEQDEVICEIRVNNMFLSDHDEKRLAHSKLDEIKYLEVKSQKTVDLIAQSVGSVMTWIPQVKVVTLETSEAIREGRFNEIKNYFKEVIEACEWITEALRLLKPELIKISDRVVFEQKWEDAETHFVSAISEIFQTFNDKDYAILADALEYELTTALDKWLELLNSQDKIVRIASTK